MRCSVVGCALLILISFSFKMTSLEKLLVIVGFIVNFFIFVTTFLCLQYFSQLWFVFHQKNLLQRGVSFYTQLVLNLFTKGVGFVQGLLSEFHWCMFSITLTNHFFIQKFSYTVINCVQQWTRRGTPAINLGGRKSNFVVFWLLMLGFMVDQLNIMVYGLCPQGWINECKTDSCPGCKTLNGKQLKVPKTSQIIRESV